MKLMIFGGTSEGRMIAEAMRDADAQVHISVATEYGKALLPEQENLTVHMGRMDADEMTAFLKELQPDLTIDATHPYAAEVTRNTETAAVAAGVPYVRLQRSAAEPETDEENGRVVLVNDTKEAVAFLETTEGVVFLTTGSKELAAFTELTNFEERCVARVLSSPDVLQKCKDLGFAGRHVIAAQGPFGEELNYAMFKEYQTAWMVTKNTGDAGGFAAKWNAAKSAGAGIVVIGRPEENPEYAKSIVEIYEMLTQQFGVTLAATNSAACAGGAVEKTCDTSAAASAREVFLVGIGPGSKDLMTQEALQAIAESDVLIGADRMIEAAQKIAPQKPVLKAYKKEEIAAFIQEHTEYQKIAVIFSGDIGYYSGAKGLSALLKEWNGTKDEVVIRNLPGLASPLYLLDRLGISWDDCLLTSMHGQRVNLADMIRTHKKVCTLLGTGKEVAEICKELVNAGLGKVQVSVGAELSYPQEEIFTKRAEELTEVETQKLAVAVFVNEEPQPHTGGFGVPDSAFIRGKVPMTKEEVRALSLCKLQLTKDAVVYDVGAGTGSVTMEMARYCSAGKVYAIERNPEALDLIKQNAEAFCLHNIEIVAGEAPECMKDLPAPTHVFLGGTGGNVKDIVDLVRSKNPDARFVMNIVTPETLAQALEFGGELVQLQISRGRQAGRYHLMTAENPIWVITF